jgi:hypothetical protein
MNISERTIGALAKIITGDNDLSPYRSGPKLVKFFNKYGYNDVYAQGFPSRWYYTEEKIRGLNNSPKLVSVIESAVDKRDYYETDYDVSDAVEYLNEYLRYDGYTLEDSGDYYRIKTIDEILVEYNSSETVQSIIDHSFINEQILKCKKKISETDYNGAITNARTLVESILIEIGKNITEDFESYDGNLPKLYRKVVSHLEFDTAQKDISETLKQTLSGMTSTIMGLSALRNKMSDAHPSTYRAEKHHAKLAVNAAHTLCDFLVETYLNKMNNS